MPVTLLTSVPSFCSRPSSRREGQQLLGARQGSGTRTRCASIGLGFTPRSATAQETLQNQGLGDPNHHFHPSAETQLCHPPRDQGRGELLLTLFRPAAGISQLSPVDSEQPSSAWIAMFLIILIEHRDVPRWRPDRYCRCCWQAEPCLLAVATLLHCHHPQSDRTQH